MTSGKSKITLIKQLKLSSRRVQVAIALTALLAIGIGYIIVTSRASGGGFVTTSGRQFMLNGQPFKFVGFNLFDAAATANYKCAWWDRYTDAELDQAFTEMKSGGATVLRFWAYQTYTNGGTDWSGVDRVIAEAKKYNFKVIPVLEDGPGYCTTNGAGVAKWQYNSDTWYTTGYKVPYGTAAMSYRSYVPLIVSHYKNEPTILGWMMMNEADTSAKRADGKSVLVDFATDIAALIKANDPNHLVTVGTQSNGSSGASGSDFTAVYSVPNVDFAEAHDWSYYGWGNVNDPLPGANNTTEALPDPNSTDCLKQYQALIACSVANAKVMNIPIIIGESGLAATDAPSRQTRATQMAARLKAAFDNGVAGYLVWQWNKVLDTEHFDVIQGTNDPILGVMAAAIGAPAPTPTASVSPTATPTPTPTPTPVPTPSGATMIDDTVTSGNPAFSYTGTWQISTGDGKYDSDDHYTTSANDSATFTFTGTRAQIYGAKASHHGIAAFSVDGGGTTNVDLYAATRVDDVVVYDTGTLSAGTHVVHIRDTGTKNASSSDIVITVDAAAYVPSGSATPTPTPTPTRTPTPTPTPTAKIGDVNGDGSVNVIDLSLLLSKWGTNYTAADFNHDGTVNVIDLSQLLSHWGG